MIPKIFHQTWKNNDIPLEWSEAVNQYKKIYQDYQYMLWTDEKMDDFVKNNYPLIYPTYKLYQYQIQRCDAFRYMVLYKYGGIYLDLDVICKSNINHLLNNQLILVKSSNFSSSFTNSFMAVEPSNPFIKYCIDNLSKYKDKYKWLGKHFHIMNTAGPLFLTNMFNQYKSSNDFSYYILDDYVGDCNVCNLDKCSGGKYFKAIEGFSWNGIDSKIYNFILCNKVLLFILIVLVILLLNKLN